MEEISLDSDALGPVGKNFFEFASARMKGQERAVRRLAKALDHAESPFRVRSRPIYSVLVVGGAGSGKSYLAKILAEFLFKNQDGLTTIPCSQFFKFSFDAGMFVKHDFNFQLQYKNSAALIPYVKVSGEKADIEQKIAELSPMNSEDEEIKQLEKKFQDKTDEYNKIYLEVEPILKNLRSIIVLDHIEEAGDAFQETLEKILEIGKLEVHSDRESWKISLENSFIFIVCNNYVACNEKIGNSKIGFTPKNLQSSNITEDGKNRYLRGMPDIKEHFSSKFLSRLDRIEILADYSSQALLDILNLFFDEFNGYLKTEFPLVLKVEDEVKEFIVKEGSDRSELGIRLLKKKFDKYISWKLELLEQKKLISKNDTIRVYMDKKDGKDIVAFAKLPSK